MKYCKKCLQPNTRPGIYFDENGVCGACLYEESKNFIDWDERFSELQDIAEWAKNEAKIRENIYDCVIGVSGGKDSTFQAVYAKEKLGLHPLLVNGAPDEITEVGRKNINNLNHLGFDIISIHTDPDICKLLAKKSFMERGNIIAASEFSLWSSAYIIADKFNIPLVIQGENAALTLGTANDQEGTGDAFNVLQTNTIKAGINNLIEDESEYVKNSMYFYNMPDVKKMKEKGIRAIWLQYYAKEWSQVYNADFSIARGMRGRTEEDLHDIGRYRRYAALDSDLQIVNQMIKYLKFGFGHATDDACYDIREGRLSRDDAKWYIKEYDGGCDEQYIEMACCYMGISKKEFWTVVDSYVNTDLFEKNDGKWQPKFEVGVDFNEQS